MPAHPLELRMSHLEGAYEQVNHRLGSLDLQMAGIGQEMTLLRQDVLSLNAALSTRIDKLVWVMVGGFATTWATTMAAILPLYFRH